ncbi:MAG: hypothetical protein ABI036_03565 [Fibrobacteria bacterium]
MNPFKHKLLHSALLGLSLCPTLAFSAWVHFDPADTSKVPKQFSKTGFYSNMTSKTVTSEAVAFDVNAPLWSDNAHKGRWILLKPGSAKIKFDPNQDYFEYPDGAVFVKLFMHDTIPGDTTTRIYWETRLLVNKKTADTLSTEPLEVAIRDKWHPFSYKWKRNGSDADLVGSDGESAALVLTVNGQKTFRKWNFPAANDCDRCHRQFLNGAQGRTVLGFFPAQINRRTAADASLNQIRNLFQKNIFTWDKPNPTEAELAAMPKWARIDDTTAALDLRAKSYIAANCSGCHGSRGIPTGALDHGRPELNYDFIKAQNKAFVWTEDLRTITSIHYDSMPFATNPAGDTIPAGVVVPGHPEISTILFRMTQRNRLPPTAEDAYASNLVPEQMPPLGVFEVDTIATRWIRKWIAGMPSVGIRGSRPGHNAVSAPRITAGYLTLGSYFRGKLMLTGLDGRQHPLIPVTGNMFRVPKSLPKGVYFLQLGNRAYKVVN